MLMPAHTGLDLTFCSSDGGVLDESTLRRRFNRESEQRNLPLLVATGGTLGM